MQHETSKEIDIDKLQRSFNNIVQSLKACLVRKRMALISKLKFSRIQLLTKYQNLRFPLFIDTIGSTFQPKKI